MNEVIVPSLFERERYCRSERSKECPIFQAFARNGIPMSEDDYWRIWLSPPIEPAKDVHTPAPTVCM